jgi:hypothetical protein
MKTNQNTHFLHECFNLIVVSSTCFEHPRVNPQEDLYMQFYGIAFMLPYKQCGRWQDVLDSMKHVLRKFKHPCFSHATSKIIFKSYKISVTFFSKLAVFLKAKGWACSTGVIYCPMHFCQVCREDLLRRIVIHK